MANLLPYSEQFQNWTQKNNGVFDTANVANAPNSGLPTADLLTDNSTTLFASLYQFSFAIDSANSYCYSVYILKDSDVTRFPMIRLAFYGDSYESHDAILNTSTGEILQGDAWPETSIGVTSVGSYWRLYVASVPGNSLNDTMEVVIYPAPLDSFDFSYTALGLGSITVAEAQLEIGTVPTAYIKTEGEIEKVAGTLLGKKYGRSGIQNGSKYYGKYGAVSGSKVYTP